MGEDPGNPLHGARAVFCDLVQAPCPELVCVCVRVSASCDVHLSAEVLARRPAAPEAKDFKLERVSDFMRFVEKAPLGAPLGNDRNGETLQIDEKCRSPGFPDYTAFPFARGVWRKDDIPAGAARATRYGCVCYPRVSASPTNGIPST